MASSSSDKALILILRANSHEKFSIQIIDNGIGIIRENLIRIFNHGFSTKKTGHGFGLHSCALVAKEMHGTLHAYSDGVNQGSTFTLELPYKIPKQRV